MPQHRPVWQRTWQAREDALRVRFARQMDAMVPHTRDLGSLTPCAQVRLQNLCGAHPGKWDRTGHVVEQLPHDQYLVRMHGSGRLVRLNRRHLQEVKSLTAYTPLSLLLLPQCLLNTRVDRPLPTLTLLWYSNWTAPTTPWRQSLPRRPVLPACRLGITLRHRRLVLKFPKQCQVISSGGSAQERLAASPPETRGGACSDMAKPRCPRRACVGEPMYWEKDFVRLKPKDTPLPAY